MSDQNPDFIIDDVDLSSVAGWDGNTGPTLPPGEYHVRVDNVELETNNKGSRSIKMYLTVLNEGDFTGHELWHWLKLPAPGDKEGVRKRLAHVVRDVLGVPLLSTGGFEAKHMLGREMIVTVSHEESTSFDTVNNIETKKVRTRVQGERPVHGAEAAPAPAPAPAPAAAPAAPAGAKAAPPRRPAAAPPRR